MKTYASLSDANYQVQQASQRPRDDEPFPCCGDCKYLDSGGNALVCSRVNGNPRVVPQGVCDAFALSLGLPKSIIGDTEMDVVSKYPPELAGEEDAK
jgi:hypothetical protein